MKAFMVTQRNKDVRATPDLQLDLRKFSAKYIYTKRAGGPASSRFILER